MNESGLDLLRSRRWLHFVESTAKGLQLHVTLVHTPTGTTFPSVPGRCAICGAPYVDIDTSMFTCAGATVTAAKSDCVIGYLNEVIVIISQQCNCRAGVGLPSLTDRASVCSSLLANFHTALTAGYAGEQRVIEMSALRQMNHITLSLFNGDNTAVERALDLLLSALIILCDAPASWVSYDDILIIKGDEDAVRQHLAIGKETSYKTEIRNGSIHGELGVLSPVDEKQATSLLPLFAQEGAIVFEIVHLFQMLHSQLTGVFGAMENGVLLVDSNGILSYLNPAAEKLLDVKCVEALGKSLKDLNLPWQRALDGCPNYQVNGYVDLLENKVSQFWVDWTISPLRKEGLASGWVILFHDRTDYHQLQEISRRAERMAVTTTLVGSLAHELRNPLAAARGLLQLMMQNPLSPKKATYPGLVVREIDRMTRLLNEFLLLGKPAKISLEPIQLDEFLCELQPLLEAEGADKGVQFTFTTPQVAPINGDIGQLTQIVMNLVRNAVEAVAEGGHVQISLSEGNQWVVLGILDNGSGVPSDVMERLFEPFYTTKSIGTGLGLPVSQAIAHNHGGHIEVENINGGAEFRLYLPKTQDAHDGVVDVVVFAADSIFVNTCERSLRAVGLRVVGCTAHDETVEAVKNRHPKVLLLGPHAGSTAADLCSGTNGVNVLYTGNPPTGDRGQGCTVNVSTVDFAKIVADVLALVNANTMDKDDKQVI